MKALAIMILWTWGLTPVWVNIVGTVMLAFSILVDWGNELKKQQNK